MNGLLPPDRGVGLGGWGLVVYSTSVRLVCVPVVGGCGLRMSVVVVVVVVANVGGCCSSCVVCQNCVENSTVGWCL